MFITLKPFDERTGCRRWAARRSSAASGSAWRPEVPEARVLVFGAAGGQRPGQRRRVQADGGGHRRRQLRRPPGARRTTWPPRATSSRASSACSTASAPGRPSSTSTSTGRRPRRWGWQLTDVFDALQAYLGSYYVNDFNRFGRTWQVNVQADAPFRVDAETVRQLKVRNADGDMVPLGAVAEVRDSAGPVQVTRYNMFPAAADQRRLAARGEHRRRPGDDGAAGGRGAAAEHDHRVDRAELPAEAGEQDRAVPRPAAEPAQRVRAGGGAGLLRAGRAVRELVAAAGGDPGRADVRAQRAGRHRPGGHGRQHLRAGRVRGAGRAGVQERHPDRRVRPRPAAGGRVPRSTPPWRPPRSGCGRS